MIAYLRRLTLVKRYFLGSLAVAIVPLILVALLYDRQHSALTNRLVLERLEGEIQATVVKIENFINVQIKRLDDLADLQEIDTVFAAQTPPVLSDQLLDFLYLETGDPDIYGIEFYTSEGDFLWSFPTLQSRPQKSLLQGARINSVTVAAPVLPKSGRPGWFYMYKPVIRQGNEVGTIAMRVRLSSLTEKAAALYRAGIYQPIVFTPDSRALDLVGTLVTPGTLLAQSRPFIPGWYVGLQQSGVPVSESGVRRWLLFFALVSALGIVWLFFSMSRRLARMILPLIDGARAIARGDLSIRVAEDSPGELGVLARSFNNMSSQLNTMITSRVDVERRAALGNLATGIAHEIRNPLATISTTVHGLIGSEQDQTRREMLEAVGDEIIRTDAIVEEFMNYARPREPKAEPVVVKDIFNHVNVLVSATALESGVKISLLGQRNISVMVDPGQLRQVLMNVVFNALQAMPEGGHLSLRATQTGNNAELTISDTGSGIEAEILAKVQQPFFTTKKGGTGLGLAICAQLISVNGGQFEIDSNVGMGTTVRITLPLVKSNR